MYKRQVQHQRVQRRARFPDALRTVCYRARVEVDPAFVLFRKRRVGGDFQRGGGRAEEMCIRDRIKIDEIANLGAVNIRLRSLFAAIEPASGETPDAE